MNESRLIQLHNRLIDTMQFESRESLSAWLRRWLYGKPSNHADIRQTRIETEIAFEQTREDWLENAAPRVDSSERYPAGWEATEQTREDWLANAAPRVDSSERYPAGWEATS